MDTYHEEMLDLIRMFAATFPYTKAERRTHIAAMERARALLARIEGAAPKPDAPLPGTGHAQWIADTRPANDPFVTDPRD